MANKKRKSRQPPTSPEQLQADAQSAFEQAQFKKASELYKQLLKREAKTEWQQALGECYRARARELMARNRPKEALALLDNLAALPITDEDKDPELITWRVVGMLQVGQSEKAAQLYRTHRKTLSQTQTGRQLPAHFAAHILIGETALNNAFAEDDPVRVDSEAALNALQAYTESDDAGAQAALQRIPFRSPYRDFALILKALLKLETNADQALAMLDKVPDGSPFVAFARDLRPAAHDDVEALKALPERDFKLQTLICELRGWPAEAPKTLRKLPRGEAAHSDKARLQFLLDASGLLPKSIRREAGLALLVTYREGRKNYRQRLGPIPPSEQTRIEALAAEHRDDLLDAYGFWLEYLDQVGKQLAPLELAALYRHIADLDDRTQASRMWLFPGAMDAAEALENGLGHDPDHRASYTRLIDLFQQSGERKHYQKWVELALERFPEDRAILSQAIEAARQKRAFRKATTMPNAYWPSTRSTGMHVRR